ncbi:copper amine oxidase N-terminal domain-containing protein [Desulfothermobacter acidiphilus]|uniref:copper amine oxidase N-terminal domain-containing protein n=1 Tax=Desulfothermobacter acidiphilus TaxID=1938353 RepID=UPI003F8C254F
MGRRLGERTRRNRRSGGQAGGAAGRVAAGFKTLRKGRGVRRFGSRTLFFLGPLILLTEVVALRNLRERFTPALLALLCCALCFCGAPLAARAIQAGGGRGLEVSASGCPVVTIAVAGQRVADVVVGEVEPGGLGTRLTLELPPNVSFASPLPEAAVVGGGGKVGAFHLTAPNAAEAAVLPGSGPVTVRVTGIRVTPDRTVPEGDLVLKVNGVGVTVGRCALPSLQPRQHRAVFAVGQPRYLLDGREYEMDAAPYLDEFWGRVFVPVRYAAYACGLGPQSVLWDPGQRTATITSFDRVVQFTSPPDPGIVEPSFRVLRINGVPYPVESRTLDKWEDGDGLHYRVRLCAPVLKDGRVYVPLRYVALAFGCQVEWNPSTQEVTITSGQ